MSLKRFSITLIYLLLISLVLCTPFIYSEEIYNGIISAKQFWFYGSMALLFLVFAFDQLFNRKRLVLKLNIIDIALLLFYIYIFIRSALTPYTPILYNTRFLNYSLLLIFYFIIRSIVSDLDFFKEKSSLDEGKRKGEVIPFTSILVLVLISTGLVLAVWGLLQLFGITRSFHSGFKITGTFFNPAPYALYLAAIFPLALCNMLETNKLETTSDNRMTAKGLITNMRKTSVWEVCNVQMTIVVNKLTYFISLLTVFTIILVLPATMNRASWLGVTIGSLFVLNYRYNLLERAKLYLNSTYRRLLVISLSILIIFIIGEGLYTLKKGSSIGRLLIWEVTIGKIIEKPLFGHGVGRFEAEYNNWQAQYFQTHPEEMDRTKGTAAGSTIFCFNEYLEITSELGVFGLLLFLTLVATVILRTHKLLRSEFRNDNMTSDHKKSYLKQKTNDNNDSFIPSFLNHSIIIISSLISLLVCAFFSIPFYSLPTIIVIFILLALLSSHVKNISRTRSTVFSFIIRVVIFSTLSTISVFLLLIARLEYKSFYTWDKAVYNYKMENYKVACNAFLEIYTPLQYTGSYLQYFGKALYMNEEYVRSLVILKRAKLYASDEVICTTLGDSFKKLKMYSDAETAYIKASFMVPHKLYPKYLLVNLYKETNQIENMLRVANKAINQKVKVESTAIKEIKLRMKKLKESQETVLEFGSDTLIKLN